MWRSSAIAIVWRTVIDGNSRASWNERPSPSSARSQARQLGDVDAAEDAPCPVAGRTKPEMRSSTVVLPAPFGPMMPTICALVDVEVDVVDGLHAAEGHRDVVAARAATGCVAAAVVALGDERPRARCAGLAVRRVAYVRDAPSALEEHRAQDLGAVEQVGGRPVEADLALLEEDGPLGEGDARR